MSRYDVAPLDLSNLNTVPLCNRGGKVRLEHFARPEQPHWLDRLPRLLAAEDFRAVVLAVRQARENGRAILWGMGGHVVKCGLAPVLIDLMDRGYVSGIAMNGAAAIHDFEIALSGQTSEDVEAVLPDGRFGSAEETGREMSAALTDGLGMGEALGCYLHRRVSPYPEASLLHEAYRRRIPVTVHVAIGTDTPHTHPAFEPGALGRATHHDFRLFCSLVCRLHEGGVYLNVGSAVLLPEVFLKAVSAARNLGHPLQAFTTANFDFLQHYRPRMNVVDRPHAKSGGKGYSITGHHELLIPLLAAALTEWKGPAPR